MLTVLCLYRTAIIDNGSQFTSEEFQSFIKRNGIKHITTMPFHPATNGLRAICPNFQTIHESYGKHKKNVLIRENSQLPVYGEIVKITPGPLKAGPAQ